MCGRYTFQQAEAMRRLIESLTGEAYEAMMARFNVAPSQVNPVLVPGPARKPRAAKMKWGTFVSFSPEAPPSFLINARSETALKKRTFAPALQARRCLVPADGFYEWKRDPKGRAKQAYYFQRTGGEPYLMAGLRWDPEGDQPDRYIVLTTAPNALLEPIHDRMPVILTGDDALRWVDPAVTAEQAVALCRSYPADAMTAHPVSTVVNSARNDVPECIVPVSDSPELEPPSAQGELF
jgi:putative SOS response-associated peptidase YedK